MMVGSSQQKTLDLRFVLFGTHLKSVPLTLRELMLHDGFEPMSPNFTVRDVTNEFSGPRITSFRTDTYIHTFQSTFEVFTNISSILYTINK
ncbi:unnamed protein product [Schistosoma margrebowiei]|uniref:Uncharacterized protein n=1 Tax=Schistosoma margrebowiei TaxID=48269 RepID=A0A183NAN2_9TREM|nr:unnamed protein product [Schistosoma margrebowiei]